MAALFDPSDIYRDWESGKTLQLLKAHAANIVERLTRNQPITTTHTEGDMARKSSSTATPKQEDNVAKPAEQEKPLTEEQQSNGQAEQTPPEPVKIPDNAVEVNGTHYVPIDEVAGKKGLQVAKLVAELKKSKGTPVEFNALCANAEAKYPQ